MKGYIYSKQDSLFGQREIVGFGEDDFFVQEIDRSLANDIIMKNHYSKKYYNATYIHLGVYVDSEIVGVLQYGYAMNPASQSSVVENTKIDEYLELNRMWIDDSAGRNSESRSIGYSVKYIKRRFPKIKWIQSFADQRCGMFGIVYQAANFKYYGEHDSIFWELDGITYHNSIKTREVAGLVGYKLLNDPKNKDRVHRSKLRQFRYIYFIDRRCIADCLLEEKPYIKYYDEEVVS